MATPRPRARVYAWAGHASEAAIVIASAVYLVSGALPALVVWEAIAFGYLVVGGAIIWGARSQDLPVERVSARQNLQWAWVLPVLSSAAGGYSAVIALAARNTATHDETGALLATAASVGIALSWLLLQIGFANIYRYIAVDSDGDAIRLPGTPDPSLMDFVYFAFTIGASFATSDAEILSRRIRRVVTVHSAVSFFYNALVVAVAFQVLQQIVESR